VGPTAAPPLHFAIIAFGKLGGKELGYASDLDLVFLYDDADEAGVDRYTRLAGRLITWLTSATAAGRLYDTDLRLRPDGAKGVLTSSVAGFWRYEREQAWTWEHQALTRARFVAGDADLGAAFEAGRVAILCLPRDRDALARQVVDMRRRMLSGHPNPTPLFDLKHDAGAWSTSSSRSSISFSPTRMTTPALTRNAGNIALLGIAGDLGLVPKEIAAEYRGCLSRVPAAPAQDPTDRRTACPGRRERPGEAARSGGRALVARLRRALVLTRTVIG
jgi:glutamate-ammonia-ligase adenylyltransferase